MNIFWHELKTYRSSTLIWTASLSLLVVLFMSLFPAMHSDIQSFTKILGNLPAPVREALGISLTDFFTVFGFYSYLLTFVTLAGAVQAMNIGIGIISKEVSGKTVDFLLTKPISRSSVITQKILAGFTTLIFTNVVFACASFIAIKIFSTDPFSNKVLLLLCLTLFFIQIAFYALGILIATLSGKIKSVISFSLPITFAFFIISSIGAIIGNTTVRYLTPFKLYDPAYIIHHASFETKYVLIEISFVVVALIVGYIIFNKKEVPSA